MGKVRLVFGILFCLIVFAGTAGAVSQMFALQGKVTQSGSVVADGNLHVRIYDAATGGTVVYDSGSDYNGTISSGFVDIMVGDNNILDLNYGQHYWMDLNVNGEDLNFGSNDRMEFEASHGDFNRIMYQSDLIFDSNGTERMRLTSGGGLAIATSIIDDTSYILDVNEEGDLGVRIFSTTTDEAAYIDIESDTAGGSISIEGSAAAVGFMQNTFQITLDDSGSAILIGAEASDANIDFFTGGDLDSAAEQYRRMRIASDGRIGFNIIPLDDDGDQYSFDFNLLTAKGFRIVQKAAGEDTEINIQNKGDGTSIKMQLTGNDFEIKNENEGGNLLLVAEGSDANVDLYAGGDTDEINPGMRITYDGNVLIGRDRPGEDGAGVPYVLDVNSYNSRIALRIDDSTGMPQVDFYVDGNASGSVGASGHEFGYTHLQKKVVLLSSSNAGYGVAIISNSSDGNIDFYTEGAAITDRRMSVTSSGTIAINHDNPATADYILDINVLSETGVRIIDESTSGGASLYLAVGESQGELSAVGAAYGDYAHLDGSLLLYAYEDTNRLLLAAKGSDANIDFYAGGDIDDSAGAQYRRMRITYDGNVGIGDINTIKAPLHINNFMMIGATSAPPIVCSTAYLGAIYIDSDSKRVCLCNGTAWADTNGTATALCS